MERLTVRDFVLFIWLIVLGLLQNSWPAWHLLVVVYLPLCAIHGVVKEWRPEWKRGA